MPDDNTKEKIKQLWEVNVEVNQVEVRIYLVTAIDAKEALLKTEKALENELEKRKRKELFFIRVEPKWVERSMLDVHLMKSYTIKN